MQLRGPQRSIIPGILMLSTELKAECVAHVYGWVNI